MVSHDLLSAQIKERVGNNGGIPIYVRAEKMKQGAQNFDSGQPGWEVQIVN